MANDMVKADKVAELDAVVQEYGLAATTDMGEFVKAFRLAEGIEKLEALITDDMMRPIMRLQNTGLGFKTDQTERGYPVDVVKRCCIEARLRGLKLVGNEFNIIKDSLYVTKDGLAHLIREWPGLTEFRFTLDIPRMANGGAIVKCSARWNLCGAPQSIGVDDTLEIPIKVNAGMGSDAILGKATRKLYHRIYTRLSGSVLPLPEGEWDEADVRQVERETGRRMGPERFMLKKPEGEEAATDVTQKRDRSGRTPPKGSGPEPAPDELEEAKMGLVDLYLALDRNPPSMKGWSMEQVEADRERLAAE